MGEAEMRRLVLHAANLCARALDAERQRTYPSGEVLIGVVYADAILRMVATCLPANDPAPAGAAPTPHDQEDGADG